MYKIYAALIRDMDEGWVWLCPAHSDKNIFKDKTKRPIVKIENKNHKKSKAVFCEARKIDENYRADYNNRDRTACLPKDEIVIVINDCYRAKLCIKKGERHDLSIKRVCHCLGVFRSGIDHPQAVVRFATWVSAISLWLGMVGIGLGVVGW